LLEEILVIDINSVDILQRYAEIDAFSQGRLNSRPLNMSARNMGKNDLWIAATTSVLDATLLTTDNDFDHLQEEFFEFGKVSINI
jgi:predicted nucleic acid-binding protein